MKLHDFLYDLSLINILSLVNEKNDNKLSFKTLINNFVFKIKNVIEDKSANVIIVNLVKIRIINKKV